MAEPLYQNDPRWKDQPIGLQSNLTIEQVGCLLTSMAMIVNHFGANETPASLNERMKANNGFRGAWIKAARVPGQFPQLGMKRQKRVQCEGTPAPMSLIDAGLEKGSLVVVRLDWTPDANIDSHWVVIHKKDGDDYLIWDPWRKEDAPKTLMGRYGFDDKTAADVILEAIWHGKGDLETAVPAPPEKSTPEKDPTPKDAAEVKPTPAPKPAADAAAVQPTVDLTFRQQPQTGTVIRVLAKGETLSLLETGASARIGQQGEWLHVQDDGGTSGYVAAWLVKEAAAASAKSRAAPPTPAPAATTVKVNANTLSFRTEPRVSDETLITYLPAGTQLTVLDAADLAKVGQEGAWLHVRTGAGKEGYVAAWYVVQA